MKNDSRRTIAQLWSLLCFFALMGFSIWFLLNGWFHEPWQQLLYFIKETKIVLQGPFWQVWDLVMGFVFLDLWLSLGLVVITCLIARKKPDMFFERWKKMLDLPLLRLLYHVLALVAAEEIVFRWFPLAILFPFWGTNFALWAIIVLSSLVFGLIHVTNQRPGKRKFIFTLPQIIGGIILSYIFLSFGFAGAMAVHMTFNLFLLVFTWMALRIDPEFLSEQKAKS